MKTLRLYVKLSFLVALAVVVSLVVFKNRDHVVTVWFFRTYEAINVLWLMLCTAGGAIVSVWILSTTLSVWRDLRDAFRDREAKRQKEVLAKQAREIEETERRIDQKLKDAVEREDG